MGIIIPPIRQIRTESRKPGDFSKERVAEPEYELRPSRFHGPAACVLPPTLSRDGLGAQDECVGLAGSTRDEPVAPSSPPTPTGQLWAAVFSFCRRRLVLYEPRTAARVSY